MADFSLKAVFGMDATGFKNDLKSLRGSFADFVSDWTKLGAAAAAGALVALSKGAIDLAGQLSDLSQNIGINVESFQAMEAQHKRNGVGSDQLTKALEKTKAKVLEAAEGNEKAERSFAALGLSSEKLIKLPLDRQYEAIAVAVSKAEDQGAAYMAVCDIMGEKVGPKLMGSLRELGEQGLPAVTKSAIDAGQAMKGETIVALDRAGDAIDDFKKRAVVAIGNILINFNSEEGLKLLGMQLLSVLGSFGGGILDAIVEAGQMAWAVFKGTFLGVSNYFNDKLVDVMKSVAGALNKVLPSNFQINIGNLDQLRSSGESVGDMIAREIAKTEPSAFKKTINETWAENINKQNAVVDALNRKDLSKDADKLRDAGNAISQGVSDAAKIMKEASEYVRSKLGKGVSESSEQFKASMQEAVWLLERGCSLSEHSLEEGGKNAGEHIKDGAKSGANELDNAGKSLGAVDKLIKSAADYVRNKLGPGVAEDTEMYRSAFDEVMDKLRHGATIVGGEIREGGYLAGEEIAAAAAGLEAGGMSAAEAIVAATEGFQRMADALRDFYEKSIQRTGANYSDQTVTSLQGVRSRLSSQLQELELDNSYSTVFAPGAKGPMYYLIKGELEAVEKELRERMKVSSYARQHGEDAARFNFGDSATNKALQDLTKDTTRTAQAVEDVRDHFKHLLGK